MVPAERILVVRSGAIGDFVLTLPALRLLRQRWADAKITLVGRPHIAELAGELFDELWDIDSASVSQRLFGSQPLPHFDRALGYLPDRDGLLRQRLREAGIQEIAWCEDAIPQHEHATAFWARPLESWGLVLADLRPPTLLTTTRAREDAARLLGPGKWVAVHAGSGSCAKNLPREWWLHWLDSLPREVQVCSISGPAEADRPRIPAAFHANQLSLPVLAALLERCHFFAGHDSGPSHIAAAVGTPAAVVFVASNPRIWAPLNPNATVLRSPNSADDFASQLESVRRSAWSP